jgi:hypothetical protein
MRIKFACAASLLALSACVSPPPEPAPQPAPQPKPVVTPTPAPPPPRVAGEWTDWPLAGGDWVYRRDERGSIALFGPAGQNATLTLRCDTQRQRIYLSREGTRGTQIVVRASSSMKALAASPTGGTPAYIAAEITPTDPILDAIALSRGRFAVETDGAQPLAIPAWAEITRIVEDCRG